MTELSAIQQQNLWERFESQIKKINKKHFYFPIALVLTSQSDKNGALTDAATRFFLQTLTNTHRVFLQTIQHKREIYQVLKKSTFQNIDMLIFNCHGNASSIKIGNSSFTENDMTASIIDHINPNGQIVLLSCNTGHNLAKKIADIAHRFVFAPNTSIRSDQLYIHMRDEQARVAAVTAYVEVTKSGRAKNHDHDTSYGSYYQDLRAFAG